MMITAIAGRTVITGLISGDGLELTSAQKRPDHTATDELWLPVGRMLEQSMKKTCKSWLQVITACLSLSATTWGQSFELGSPGANSPSSGMQAVAGEDYGSVKLGGQPNHSASAYVPAPNIQQTQFSTGAPPMFSDAMIPADDSVGFAATRPEDRILFRAGNNSGSSYGIVDGYTNLNAFIPLSFDSDRSLWWINPRVNISDAGNGSSSIGVGHRVYIPEDDRVYGASFWWDNDTNYGETFNQLGGSFESIGRYTDLRMNFSIPVGETSSSSFVSNSGTSFVGNTISLQRLFREEEAFSTYDAEVAIPFPGLGDFGVDLGVGVYYLGDSAKNNSVGVSARTQAQISDNFWLNGVYTNDDTFGSNFSINVELTMPASGPVRWFRQRPVAASLTDSVQRRYRIAVNSELVTRNEGTINPKTGSPYFVAHIDPDATSTGTGTVLDPFVSLEAYAAADASLFDIIYVQPRADETDVNLNTGIDLLSGQRLLSSSVPHSLESGGEIFPVPGFVASQPLPLLSSTGFMSDGSIVTLETGGSCFEVAGFQIDHMTTLIDPGVSTGNAITGDMVSDVSINRNILENSEYATQLTDFSGSLHYRENVLRDNTVGGLQVEYTGDGELALFSNSTFNNMGIGFEVIADAATVTADNLPTMLNTAPDPGTPVFTDPDGFVDLTGLSAQDTVFPFDPTTMATGIQGNFVNLNETGMLLESINGGVITANVEDNTFSNNQDIVSAGFVANSEGVGSTIDLVTFQRNTLENNIGSGAILASRDGGVINTPLQDDPLIEGELIPGFTNNIFNQNSRNGLSVVVDNSTMNDFVVGSNMFTNNTESGFAAYLNDATFDDWEFDLNIFDGNDRDGLALVMDNSTNNQFLISNNELTNNGGNGINVIGVDSELSDLIIDTNLIQGNGAPIGGFNINVVFLGGLNPAQQAEFNFAANRWAEMIIGDLPDVVDPTFGLIDDLLITAEGTALGGGTLGQAGFTQQRNDADMLPYLGLMEFDTGFLAGSTPLELRDVIIHEMGHVIGFTDFLWNQKGLIDYNNAIFTGVTATAEHNALFGLNDAGVPVQTGVGPGSDFAHWDDALYGDELMTFSATGTAPRRITRVTAGMFQDLGYVVDLDAADQTFPLVPGSSTPPPSSVYESSAPDAATIAANEQKLAAYMLQASTLPLDDPGVEQQMEIAGNSGIQFNLTDSIVNATLTDNTIDQNLSSNLRADLMGTSEFNLNSSRDMYTASGAGSGLNIIARDTSLTSIDLQNAMIVDNNQSGLRGETFNDSRMGVSVTSPIDPDFTGITTISDNGVHGISLVASPDSPSTNTSEVDLLVEDTLFNMNGQRGINLLASESSQFGNSTDPFLDPVGDPILIQNNMFTSNGSDGIGTNRRGDAFINAEILNNSLSGNGGDGISLLAQNANTIDTYLIQDNLIEENTRGIHLRVEADAIIDATINNNLIQNNRSHGILVDDRANSALDQRYVTGVWTQNMILNNGGSGILLDGSYGTDPAMFPDTPQILEIGQLGDDVDGDSLGNIIDGNGGWGIQSTAVGIANIHNNDITNNGSGGINIESSIGGNTIDIDTNFIGSNGGIGIELLAENGVSLETMITNNTVTANAGDGIELATLDVADSDVTIDTNIIFDNGGRGIDILNAGAGPSTTVTVDNNFIDENGGEGVYVVNTASVTQYNSKDGPTPGSNINYLNDPTHGMDATGGVFNDPSMVFNMNNNMIRNNGEDSLFDATGFVMRIGTSDATSSPFFDGGYASDGFGGVVATITDNVMSGNFGTDVWFESFTSTVDPRTTTGNWNATMFNITGGYQSDPLARLDLVFTGNSGDSIDVANSGAWYDNAEGTFKSRLSNIAAASFPGPFPAGGPGASRRRNAQRLASRDAPFSAPLAGPDGGNFLYPGVGTSTFRVSAPSTIGFVGSGASNEFSTIGSTFLFAAPIDIPSFFGELFFDWDTTTYIP